MDNFSINLTAESKETLLKALEIIFNHNAPGGKAVAWKETKIESNPEWIGANPTRPLLILLWHKDQDSIKLPSPLNVRGACELIQNWLNEQDYGHEPDHDGDNGKGFRLFCDHWGHVEGEHYAIIGVTPAWAMYGK